MTPVSLHEFLSNPIRDITLPYVYPNGNQYWFDLDGYSHRDNDLPATVLPGLHQSWYFHGNSHRENDLPAVVYSDGFQQWLTMGTCHRTTGPAVIHSNGSESYYLNGVFLTYEEWLEKRHQYLPTPPSRFERQPLL